jgi:hypothetical protein
LLYAPDISRTLGSNPPLITRTEPLGGEAEPRADRPTDGRERNLLWLAGVLTVAPLAVSALYLLVFVGADYFPSGDIVGTEMRTRDVGNHAVWLGPFSRDGWFHPGPLLFYLLAVPYRLLGSSSVALSVGALLINGASVVGMAVIARRRGGVIAALLTLVCSSLLLRALGPEFLRVPWNVYVTVLPYGLLLFLCWTLVCGDRWAVPVAVFVASFLVQTHVGHAALALPVLGVATAWLVAQALARRRQDGSDGEPGLRELVRPGLLSVGVAAVLWAPPVVEQLRHDGGNLGRIVGWFRDGGDEVHSLLEGWRVVARQYAIPPEWVAGAEPVNFLGEPTYVSERVVPVLLVVAVIAAVVLWRRAGPRAGGLIGVWALASVLGVVATARTVGPLFGYRLHWSWVLGMVGGMLILWAGSLVVQDRGPALGRALVPLCVVAVAVLGAANAVSAVRAGTPGEEQGRWMDELGPALRAELADLPRRDGDVLIRSTSFSSVGYATSLALDLERHGRPARLPTANLGEHRAYKPGAPLRAVVDVVVDGDIPEFLDRSDLELIAYAGDDSLEQLAADAAEADRLQADFEAGELSLDEFQRRTDQLVPAFSAVGLFLHRAGDGTG